MPHFSPGETLSAIHSMIIYIIMRTIASGADYFRYDRRMLEAIRVRLFQHTSRRD
jgi:hypothetical protein